MKKYRREIIIAVLFLAVCAELIVFDLVSLLADEQADFLLRGTLSRILAFCLTVPIVILLGYGKLFFFRTNKRALLWCFPCLLVAVVNFPFTALLGGSAAVDRPDLVWLFAVYCISIGLLEETLFRGLLQALIFDALKKRGAVIAILVNSALFGLWHLTNLFAGAGVGPTLLQVGYSFLLGAMWSSVCYRTGNIWTGVVTHALFDFGGMLVDYLGHGMFQDTVFWVLTVVAGVLCAAHTIAYFVLEHKRKGAEIKQSNNF